MELFRVYPTIDSTNLEATRLLQSNTDLHGVAILANHQTKGRGQYGREWYSEPGTHLAMSIILQSIDISDGKSQLLALKTSLSILHALHKMIPGIHATIKWPNDIYLGQKKLAGILIENSWQSGKLKHSIIGIGINVNEEFFPASLPNAISLFQQTGKKYDLIDFAKLIYDETMKSLIEDSENWINEYTSHMFGINEKFQFEVDQHKMDATIRGIQPDGQLIIETEDGMQHQYFSHQIKWLL